MKRYIILGLCFVVSFTASAQTHNFGEFVVVEGTVFSNEQVFHNRNGASFINDGETFLYGDLINNGALDFTPSTNGVTNFVGNATQNLAGAQPLYFNNVVFNNTSAALDNIRLNNIAFIANIGNFTDGIVNIDDNSGQLIFENNAVTTNTNNNSFVDGLVTKDGNNAFNFPVGDAAYFRLAAISAPANAGATFTAKYFLEDPDTNYPRASKRGVIEAINDSEYWVIENRTTNNNENLQKSTRNNEEVFITLSYNSATTPVSVTPNGTITVHIIRWNATENIWEDEGGVVDEFNNTITTLTTVDNYGVFTLGRVDEEALTPTGEPIYNAITANGDGKNDYFRIEDLEKYQNNEVLIFNRWGVEIYGTKNYGASGNVFRGLSKNASKNGKYLPTGTYFYILTYDAAIDGATSRKRKTGFIHLNSN
ncbi:gliding motility-associated C-terminal domain-containing protein [uncultured Polaribacter sp.]|uniref:gliding motility-associated C-terminal domain-containing protein n=1 Tax=uncultured Polaribacter sp. TaxID=174711 RepID=UPI002614F772|nr:gliding motility-associated C-terminal domain-containing protein [uncultured Polaribacter sp.]